MSVIYNKAYKVPSWVLVTSGDEGASAALDFLHQNGALQVQWPGATFKDTVTELGKRGYAHEVSKDMPYQMSVRFLEVAVAKHIKESLGSNKMLSGAPSQPMHVVNRSVQTDADFERIFNEVIQLEDSIALSHLFDVGSRCFGESTKYKVFYTVGDVPRNVLQRISDSVIVVGDGGEIATAEKKPKEVVTALDSLLTKVLGL